MAVSGHDYERFAPQGNAGRYDLTRGIMQFVVGTGVGAQALLLWREGQQPGAPIRAPFNATDGPAGVLAFARTLSGAKE